MGIGSTGLKAVVDLEWTPQQLLVAQKLQELGVVLCSTPNKVDRLATRRAILHVLAAVKEAALVLLGPNVLHLGNQGLAGTALICLCDIDEE